MKPTPVCVALLLVALNVTGPARAAEPTSENNEQLKKWLTQFPEADANKDGILTWTEAQAYRAKIAPGRGKQGGRAVQPPPVQPDHANLSYGPHERNVMDLWLTKTGAGPRPLVVYIHGGGWVGGDKAMVPPGDLTRLLEAGMNVASINYRYSTTAPYPAPIRDGGLAIQFLRQHAGEYNIDPARVGAYGASAGAVTSLWLAFHDELADPKATDPVLRQSTRLTCAGSIVGPTTLDKKTMDEWFGMKVATHPAFYPFYGLQKGDEQGLYSDRVRKIAADASPINHLTKDDPPVFLFFPQDLAPLPPNHTADMVHHPLFGAKLKEACDKVGVECTFQAKNKPQDRYTDMVAFFVAKMEAKK